MQYAAATVASKSRIALARVTARSFVDRHPEIPFFHLLADEPPLGTQLGSEPARSLPFETLELPREEQFRFRYTEMELSYAVTPFLIARLLEQGYDGVLFLKQETLVLQPLDDVFSRLQHHSVILTPHLIQPPRKRAALSRELNVLQAGVFNGGVVAFNASREARRVLSWWMEKTSRTCRLAVQEGLHYEQRWLDWVPVLAPGCCILRDPGINIGHWNLAERCVRFEPPGFTVNGVPVRVFRFSGYRPDRPQSVSRYDARRVKQTGDAARIFARYREMLMEAGWSETFNLSYGWDYFDDGSRITPVMRAVYRSLGEHVEVFGNPFQTSGDTSFHAWLREYYPQEFEPHA